VCQSPNQRFQVEVGPWEIGLTGPYAQDVAKDCDTVKAFSVNIEETPGDQTQPTVVVEHAVQA